MSCYNSKDTSALIYYEFKLILLGDSGVGKTSLLNRYMDQPFIFNQSCTVNVDFKIKLLIIDLFYHDKQNFFLEHYQIQ